MGAQVTHAISALSRNFLPSEINATRFIVATVGVLFALAGIDHGFFETLQGYTPTPGFIIHAIGEHNRMWVYGTEDALTLIPNFVVSGIVAIGISLLIAVWSVGFVQKKHGSTIFLLLFIFLFLSGGGLAQIVYFTLAWAVSTRINKPLTWLRRSLPARVRVALGMPWLWLLGGFTLPSLMALEIAIFGYVPGVSDPKQALHICWSLLAVGSVFLLLAIASGFIHDADRELGAMR
ncbi:MAG: hypothetical protein WBP85_16805 [Terracidiphilus sp.]